MKTATFLLLLVLSASTYSQQSASIKKIDELLSYYESKNEFMGSVALSENGKVIFAKAYGFSDAENNKKADVNTKYKIGSITKMFTAAVVFQLIEEGKLQHGTKLSQFFPEIPNADAITVAHLLNHRSGIFNYTDDETFMDFVFLPQDRAMLLDRIKSYPTHFVPDSKSEYSNSNYMLLGMIIEDVTKKSYQENVDDRIIKKIGLKNTSYGGVIDGSKNEAFSYDWHGGKWNVDKQWDMSLAGSAGALISTPTDLTKFIEALFDGKIISQTSLSTMTTVQDGYGSGIFPVPFDRKKGFGHTGGIEHFVSMIGYFPEDKLALAICANAQGANNNDIAIGILSLNYGIPFKFPNLDKMKIDDVILQKYEGVYSSPAFPLKVTITKAGGFLSAQATGQSSFTLDATSNTVFTFQPAGLELIFSEDKMVLKQGGAQYELNKEK